MKYMVDLKQLKFAYWYAVNRQRLKRLFLYFLIFLTLLFWGIALTVFIRQFGIFRSHNIIIEQTLSSDLVNYFAYQNTHQPSTLEYLSKTVLRTRENTYDLILKVKNPNDSWYASFDYAFVYPSGQTQTKKAFLLPGEERNFTMLGVKNSTFINSFDPNISNLSWKRIENAQRIIEEKFDFSVIESSVSFSQKPKVSQNQLPVSTLSFQIRNNSAYSYWNVVLSIAIASNNRIIAVNNVSVDQFLSGQTREIVVNWFDDLPQLANPQISVFPVIDIFDEASIIVPNGI